MISRRRFIQSGLAAAATVTLGPAFWREALAASTSAQPGPGPYGPLLPADANGIQLPARFTSRVIATSNQLVPGTAYLFPVHPDGQAAFKVEDTGGWILCTNTEIGGIGGASMIEFDAAGTIVRAQRILEGTDQNCAGGPTPWGTWLSCEEVARGSVWECDPTQNAPVEHQAMGVFQHEAACVDPVHQHVYLSEDVLGGGLYRFRPDAYPILSAGTLEIACGGPADVVWKALPDPRFTGATPCRDQLPDAIEFARGEGMWFDAGVVYLATTADESVHAYDTNTGKLEILYRLAEAPGSPLKGVDNVHGSPSGDLFVCEDSYDNDPDAMDICIITPEGDVARFLKLTGIAHFVSGAQSETTGVCFDPSGTRMYLSSQRYGGLGGGIVYEISGPFRQQRVPRPPKPTPTATPTPTPTPPAPPAPPAPGPQPGMPIGLDVAKRITYAALIRSGLGIGMTLNRSSTVRVKMTARITRNGRRRTVTLATLTRTRQQGRTMLRIKPSKSAAMLLRGRRRALTAKVEIRITAPGAPARVFTRNVSLRA